MESDSDEREEFVELSKVQGDFEAQVLKGLLSSEGIDSWMKSTLVQTVHPLTVDGLGVVTVLVRKSDLERAREILTAFKRSQA